MYQYKTSEDRVREAIADVRNFVLVETADLKKLRYGVIDEVQLIATLVGRLKALGTTLEKLKEIGE